MRASRQADLPRACHPERYPAKDLAAPARPARCFGVPQHDIFALVVLFGALLAPVTMARAQDALLADQQGTTGAAADLLQPQGRTPLPADIALPGGLTLRFVELGEFRASRLQGLEIDLVNAQATPLTLDITMILTKDAAELARTEQTAVQLAPQTRKGFRVAIPLAMGAHRVSLVVKSEGKPVLEKSFDFTAAGPVRLTCKPYLLSRGAYLVKAELRTPELQAKIPSFRFKLLDREGKKVLWEGRDYRMLVEDNPFKTERRQTTGVEGLVQLGENPPGDYVIEVEVTTPTTQPAQARLFIRSP